MYHWVYILTESVWASWTFGWMELLGQIASVSAVAFVWAVFAQEVIILATANSPDGQQMVPGTIDAPNQVTQNRLFALYSGALVSSGIANSINTKFLDWMTVLCAWFCLAAIATICIVVPAVAPTHQKASWVFSAWVPTFGEWYLQDKYTAAYSAIMALLLPAYNFACYDGPAHMAEEQKDAARAAPRAILVAIISSAITGWALVIAMLFSIQDLGHVLATTSDYTGLAPGHGLNSPAQIMWDAFGARYNKSYLGNMLMCVCVWFAKTYQRCSN